MCGIAGIAAAPGGRVAPEEVAPMVATLDHRGPDGSGVKALEGVALGHARLAIIDVAGGDQPLANEDGTVWVTFNGEVYDHHELRAELAGEHAFRTRCDTEVLVHAYEQWGDAFVERLHGFFAFALWDARRRRLLLARDPLGKKPLFVAEREGRLYFASETKALLAALPGDPELDPAALDDALALRYVGGRRTGFHGIERLLPGERAVWEDGRLTRERFWTPPDPAPEPMDREAAVEGLRARLDAAVARRLESEVPLGLLLSGGLDSTAVLEAAARVSGERLRTFTVGFSREKESEAGFAAAAAEHFGTEHHEFALGERDLLEHVDAVLPALDEPLCDPSFLPTALVCRLARTRVTVCLTGDGGDETFGGYNRYRQVLDAPPPVGQGAAGAYRWAAEHLPLYRGKAWKLARGLRRRAASPEERYVESLISLAAPYRAALLGPRAAAAAAEQPAPEQRLLDAVSGPGDLAARMMRCDLEHYLPGLILTKVDRASMLSSVEARSPFLDVDLVEWAARVPTEWKLGDGQQKRLVRALLEGRVPTELLTRKKKGFGTPLGRWFRGELRPRLDDLLLDSRLAADGWLDAAGLRALVGAHVARRRNLGEALWSLVVLETWYRGRVLGAAA